MALVSLRKAEAQIAHLTASQDRLSAQVAGLHQSLSTAHRTVARIKARLFWPIWRKLRTRTSISSDDLGELTSWRTIEQRIEVTGSPLWGVSIQIGTFQRTNWCAVRVRLRRADDFQWLRAATADARHIQDNSYVPFRFEPLTEEGTYVLVLDSPDGLPGSAVTAFRTQGTGLTVDGQRVDAALRHQLLYARAHPGGQPPSLSDAPITVENIHVWCDRPAPTATGPIVVGGTVLVAGWAVARRGLESVDLFVDDRPNGQAALGFARPDVARLFPDFLGADRAGFRALLDCRPLDLGPHSLVIRASDTAGSSAETEILVVVDPSAASLASIPDYDAQYQLWFAHHWPTATRLDALKASALSLPVRPTISLLMPVFNTDPELLRNTLDSVTSQVYPDWQLCAVDDASPDRRALSILDDYARGDGRIAVRSLPQNRGIAGASQVALEMATGEFVGLLDHDDLLWPNALLEVARRINAVPDADVLYSDEDKVTPDGHHYEAFFKPDWSPQLLLSMNYLSHFGVYRRSLVLEAGGFDTRLSGSQDYDLALRTTERARRVEHIPTVLYSWRSVKGSAAAQQDAKPYALQAARQALERAVSRRTWEGHVESGLLSYRWRVRPSVTTEPLVSVVIPTASIHHIGRCVESLIRLTSYSSYEVIIVENSGREDVVSLCDELTRRYAAVHSITHPSGPFNYSAINNRAVRDSRGTVLCLLNDDTEVIEPGWLDAMVEVASLPDVGVVGARLLYPDRTIQHAGVLLGVGGVANHAFRGFPCDHPGHMGLASVVRDVSAVTFACAVMRRDIWDACRGLDEHNLPVGFNDVDFCLRAREAGYRILYTPHATLLHHESATRGAHNATVGEAYMYRRWAREIAQDPFYNPNLTRHAEDYGIAL
jgi:O-antigen biosynthesis protein